MKPFLFVLLPIVFPDAAYAGDDAIQVFRGSKTMPDEVVGADGCGVHSRGEDIAPAYAEGYAKGCLNGGRQLCQAHRHRRP